MSIARKSGIGLSIFGFLLALALGCNSHSSSAATYTAAAVQEAPLTINPTFQTRNPRPCPSIRSAPSNAQAAVLVQCTQDSIARDHIMLMQNVSVSVGHPRTEAPFDDQQGIDNTAPVYDITGSEVMYNCQIVDNVMNNAGKNCNAAQSLSMTGICYRNTSGDWRCLLGGGQSGWIRPSDPPPTTY